MRCDNDGSLVSPVSALERAQRVVGLWYRLANDWLLTQGRTVDQHYLEGRHQPPTPQSTTPSRQLRFIPKNKFITMKLVSILLAKLTVKAFKTRPEVSSSATTPGLTPGKEVKKNSVENKAFLLEHTQDPFKVLPLPHSRKIWLFSGLEKILKTQTKFEPKTSWLWVRIPVEAIFL